MKILAIETSCDETSVAVLNDTVVLSCVTATSLSLHAETGGIIPERAARKQIEYIIPTLEAALKNAFPSLSPLPNILMKEIDVIAVTAGPGLIGSLLVGVETAKTLSAIYNKPIVPVNHIKAHIYAAFIDENKGHTPTFPLLAAVVSGGHTDFVMMQKHGEYQWVGGTRDDAAGECFDKCARLLRLPYPGGPSISEKAKIFREKDPDTKLSLFPRPMIHENNFDVSFSGLKTAVANYITNNKDIDSQTEKLCAEIEEAISDTLIFKIIKIAKEKQIKDIVLCGGVSANQRLKEKLDLAVRSSGEYKLNLHVPLTKYSTDNAAMIGAFAVFNYEPVNWSEVEPNPELHF